MDHPSKFPERFTVLCKDIKEAEAISEAFKTVKGARPFSLLLKKNEDGTVALFAVPFEATTDEAIVDDATSSDATPEVWCASICTAVDDFKVITGESSLVEDYVEKVKKTDEVRKGVVLLPHRGESGLRFSLQASSIVASGEKRRDDTSGALYDVGITDLRPTKRLMAAIRGFKALLIGWLCNEHTDELRTAYELLLEAKASVSAGN